MKYIIKIPGRYKYKAEVLSSDPIRPNLSIIHFASGAHTQTAYSLYITFYIIYIFFLDLMKCAEVHVLVSFQFFLPYPREQHADPQPHFR